MKLSLRKRPMCIEPGCDVEINPDEKRCAAHNWVINTWLEKSRKALKACKGEQETNGKLSD